MNSNNYPSLTRQLMLRLGIIAALVFIMVAVVILERSHTAINDALDRSLMARARALQTLLLEDEYNGRELAFEDKVMREYGGRRPAAFFLIVDQKLEDGGERSESLEGVEFEVPTRAAEWNSVEPYYWDMEINQLPVRCLAMRPAQIGGNWEEEDEGENENGESGAVGDDRGPLLIVAEDRSPADNEFATLARRSVIILGIGFVAFLLAGWAVLAGGLQPLRRLQRDVERISPDDFAPVTVPSIAEIAKISAALNGLLSDLESAFTRERRFTADAAHELRTPVSELRTLAEVALKYPELKQEQHQGNYQDVLAAAEKMQNLVETLLTISRYDAGALVAEVAPLPLAPLFNDVWKRYAPLAEKKAIRATIDAADNGIVAMVDPRLLRVIGENLFANAVEYCPRGGELQWCLTEADGRFVLTVSNSVTGLDEIDMEHLFERFWRKDTARTADNGHSGLGLSLAQSLAALLGFTLSAELKNGGTITVTVSGATG